MRHRPPEDGPLAHELGKGDYMPADVLVHPEWYTGFSQYLPGFWRTLRAAQGRRGATLRIYRALPQPHATFREGDWVTLSLAYAKEHLESNVGEGGHIIAADVPASSLRFAGDDLMEWGYWGPTVAGTPVRRANPRRRHPDPTYTPTSSAAFRRWFGKSKVVDAEGKPRVVYHGTAYAPGQPHIAEFRGPHQPFRYPAFSGGRGKFVGVGSFFSESEEVAASYPYVSLPQTQNYTRVVHSLYLRIEKPKTYRTLRAAMDDMVNRAGPDPVAFVALLRAEGYDGITFMEGPSYNPTDAKKKARVWITFDPRQVKSATDNVGTFDPDDPNLLRNPRRRNPARSRR